MAKREGPDLDDALARLDPDVAALVRAANTDDDRRRSVAAKSIFHEIDGRPTELKLKPGPAALLCTAAGIASAAGALFVFNMGDADLLWLIISQMPAAGLMTIAWRVHEQRKART